MKKNLWLYRITLLWAVFFSFNALGTSVLAAIVNVDWSKLNTQAKVIIFIIIFVNWSGTMIAFFTQSAKKIEDGQLPINGNIDVHSGDTAIITKTQTQTTVQTNEKT